MLKNFLKDGRRHRQSVPEVSVSSPSERRENRPKKAMKLVQGSPASTGRAGPGPSPGSSQKSTSACPKQVQERECPLISASLSPRPLTLRRHLSNVCLGCDDKQAAVRQVPLLGPPLPPLTSPLSWPHLTLTVYPWPKAKWRNPHP